ncbi:UNVERIFIED_CONTAM: hypothetical protein HDU68_011824, partial [Siphonaria sp. JEL0065]
SATNAGIHTLPLLMGMVVSSVGSGAAASTTGYFFPYLPIGAILTSIGAGLISTMDENAELWKQVIYLLICGLGVGMAFQMCVVSAQVSVTPDLLAAVTSTNNFIQTIGLAIGIAVCSSIFNTNLPTNIASNLATYNVSLVLPPGVPAGIIFQDPSVLHNPLLIPSGGELQKALVHGYLETLQVLFYLPVGFALAWFVACFFVKKERIPQGTEIAMGA